MKLWFYYTRLAIQDLVRLWTGTQHHVIIVAGICLPILLLLGLKRGHVADLQHELLTSPTGRQVVFWSARQGELLSRKAIARLREDVAGTDLIIPETQRLVRLTSLKATRGSEPAAQTVTLYSTCSGDPILAQVGGDVLNGAEHAVVLPEAVAVRLGVSPKDRLLLTVERERGGAKDSASLEVEVKAIITVGAEKTGIAYADIQLLDWLEQYVRGFRVEALDWPALKIPVRDRYSAYLLFCEAVNDLTGDDIKALEDRGLNVEPIHDSIIKSLYGLLKRDSFGKLRAYRLTSLSSRSDPKRRLGLAPSEIAELTVADDVVIPWNDPQDIDLDGGKYRLVGLSLPQRTWFREYMETPKIAFDYEAETGTGKIFPSSVLGPQALRIPLGSGESFELKLVTTSPQSNPLSKPPVPKPPSDERSKPQPKASGSTAGSPLPTKPPESANTSSEGNAMAPRLGPPVAPAKQEPPVQASSASKEPCRDLPPTTEAFKTKPATKKQPHAKGPSVPTIVTASPVAKQEAKHNPPTINEPRAIETQTHETALHPIKSEPAESRATDSAPSKPEPTGEKPSDSTLVEFGHVQQSHVEPGPRAPDVTKRTIGDVSTAVLVVPAPFLAHFDAWRNGLAVYDPELRLFVPVPEAPIYDKARLFATTIDDVPRVVSELAGRKFAVMSESARITEIHQQDQSLQLLVYVVGVGVFLFGVITVVSVLLDSTDRKRGTIGILRVMGVSRFGIVYLVLLRAAAIGILAGVVSVAFGYLISLGLAWPVAPGSCWETWKPTVTVIVTPTDVITVFLGALTCSGLGAIFPSWRASRMDPFDAIVEGRFR